MLTKLASGRIGSSGVHSATANVNISNAKRTANTNQPATTDASLGSAAKLGQSARDKERKEKEDVELRPPPDLLPYSQDPSCGAVFVLNHSDCSRIS